jgi:hypothetical protein
MRPAARSKWMVLAFVEGCIEACDPMPLAGRGRLCRALCSDSARVDQSGRCDSIRLESARVATETSDPIRINTPPERSDDFRDRPARETMAGGTGISNQQGAIRFRDPRLAPSTVARAVTSSSRLRLQTTATTCATVPTDRR